MDRVELTFRLRQLGMKKPAFAARLGMASDTVYQWDQVPQYAVAVVELLEERNVLMEKLREALGSIATLKVERMNPVAEAITKGRKK